MLCTKAVVGEYGVLRTPYGESGSKEKGVDSVVTWKCGESPEAFTNLFKTPLFDGVSISAVRLFG